MNIAQIFGLIKAHIAYYALNQETINGIAEKICSSRQYSRKQIVVMVGFTNSGKTKYIENRPEYNDFFKLDSREIHELLNRSFGFLRDDNTVNGSGYWARQWLTQKIRERTFKRALEKGFSIIIDAANLERKKRYHYLKPAKEAGYTTTIIQIICSEITLFRRLARADQENINAGKEPTWIQLYFNVQRDRFEPPSIEEADHLVVVNDI